MASLEEVKEVRLEKLEKLKSLGINPYPAVSNRTHTISEISADFSQYEIQADNLPKGTASFDDLQTVTLAGRVMSFRGQGALIFFNLNDGTGTFQGLFRVEKEGVDPEFTNRFALFNDTVDVGDFIDVTGILFTTKTGQRTILVTSWRMLTKSLLPLPEKWHGLQDADEKYRKRYLDILTNPELREMFEKKSKFWEVIRNFLISKNFLEVDTPTLEVTTGGAEAAPFKTHHNDFDMDVYMRISVGELWQKRLMAAGFPKTFEIGRAYRNEGTSPNHLQEFTNAEFYWAYADYKKGMPLVMELYRKIAVEVFGTTKFSTRGHEFDLADEWKEISYVDEIKRQTGVDVLNTTEQELAAKLKELSVVSDAATKERMIDSLWKHCRKSISGPAFLTNYPDFMQPLAKRNENNKSVVEQFQVLIGGAEIGKGYSELNDPIDQRERFNHQQELLKKGDAEAMMPEWDFVDMLEHGMPPTFGFGFGERLFAFLVDKPIRETQLFPLMRPEDGSASAGATNAGSKSKKKESEVAVILLNRSANLLPWQRMNTVAHLSASFAASAGKKLFTQEKIKTADNKDIKLNIQHAILIKELPDNASLKSVLAQGADKDLAFAEFTREMLETTNDKKVIAATEAKNFDEVEHLGVLVFGPKSAVEEVTAGAELAS